MIDLGAAAVTARLRELSRLLDSRGFVIKQVVDMQRAAVTSRLRVMGALSDMCRRLVEVGRGMHAGPSPSREAPPDPDPLT